MTTYCGQPDESQWAPVAGDPAQTPAPPPPVSAEPVPEDTITIDPETFDPCDEWAFPEDQPEVYELLLSPPVILPPYLERGYMRGIAVHTGLLRVVPTETIPILGITGHIGFASQVTVTPPQKIPAVYTQSSVYSQNQAATQEGMQNDSYQEVYQTGTNYHTTASGGAWVRMDFGRVRPFDAIVVGCDFDNTLLGGWGTYYVEDSLIMASNDGVNWTTIGNLGTFAQGIQTYETPGQSWRYVRIWRGNDYLSITEFYALTDHHFVPLLGEAGHSGHLPSFAGIASHQHLMEDQRMGITVHAGIRTPWTPGELSGTRIQLSAKRPGDLTITSGRVDQWNDISGNLRHAIAGGAAESKPIYGISPINGLPGVKFDVADNYLVSGMSVPSSAATFKFLHNGTGYCFVAASTTLAAGTSGNIGGILGTILSTSQGPGFMLSLVAIGSEDQRLTGNMTRAASQNVASEQGPAVIQRQSANLFDAAINALTGDIDAKIELSLNGAASETTTGTGYYTPSANNSAMDLRIGYTSAGGGSATLAFPGFIHEVVIVEGELTQAEIDRVRGYLAHEWQMAEKLPGDHPYRYVRPLIE